MSDWLENAAERELVAERLFAKVEVQAAPDGCWNWTGGKRNGYGALWMSGRSRPTHRLSYELIHGPIPAGLQIDHLCRNRACCNPAHLEAVTLQENVRRGDAGKHMTERAALATHCKRGHEYTPENLLPNQRHRHCKECRRLHWPRKNALRRAARAANPSPPIVGSLHPNAKLTEEAVREIRATAGQSMALARKFGVADATIYAVRSRKIWKHA